MIQRIQTLWLALSFVAGILTLKFSFFSGNKTDKAGAITWQELTAVNNLFILFLSVAVAVMAVMAIFLFKNRKLQLRVTLLSLVLSLINIALYHNETRKFTQGNYDLTAILALSIPIFLVLASRGIYKDEKLIKSADRLR